MEGVYIGRGPVGGTARRELELVERMALDPWFDACILLKHTLLIVSFKVHIF